MAYPGKFQDLVDRYGKTLDELPEVLVDRLNECDGNIRQCSENIDIGYDKLFKKIQDLELVRKPPHWEVPERRKHADPV